MELDFARFFAFPSRWKSVKINRNYGRTESVLTISTNLSAMHSGFLNMENTPSNHWAECDPGLLHLAQEAELLENIWVVLQTRGIILSGMLISPKEFFGLEYESMKKEVSPEQEKNVLDEIATLVEVYDYKQNKQSAHILFLKDVTLLAPQHQVKAELWRVRASSVDGWYFGQLDTESLYLKSLKDDAD
ncbi:MAG: hypothetical protein EOP04_14495 [Proteobacteria bacterium]|nr:MAG: hypothetical protein EOP04_14495 [Pseudomonadota bacterium]